MAESPSPPRDLDATLVPPTDPDATVAPPQSTLSPAADSKIPGTVRVPGYDILGVLGHGGMGVVYQARHLVLNRLVALKMILSGSHASGKELARFRDEAAAVARLQHPNLVQIYDVGEHEGRPYLALEYVDGGSLDRLLRTRHLEPNEAARLTETLARAVHAVHQHGLIHRDLKPGNVLLTADGVPKITDFGLAKRLDSTQGKTMTGDVLGTPAYMAPEQAAGKLKDIGPATDVYALGAILYEMLTGRPPFSAASGLNLLLMVARDEPQRPSSIRARLPRDLETICLKCLEKQPHRRYASAKALADDLHRFLNNEPIQARPVHRLGRLWRRVSRAPGRAALVAGSVLTAAVLVLLTLSGFFSEEREAQRKERSALEAEAQGKRTLALGHFQGALEVYELTGKPISEWHREHQERLASPHAVADASAVPSPTGRGY